MKNIVEKFWTFINPFNPDIKLLLEQAQALKVKIGLKDLRIEQLKKPKVTALDKYCKEHFKSIPMIAYKQKREVKGKYYPIALNELITPNSFSVKKLFKRIKLDGSVFGNAKKIGNKVAKTLTWDDDKNLAKSGDYYLYPNESIARVKCDCEDHSFVTASGYEEIGIAWGFHGTNGHAFNVFIDEGELYILETNDDNVDIKKYSDQSTYQIYYIITRNHAYEIDGRVVFGQIAWG